MKQSLLILNKLQIEKILNFIHRFILLVDKSTEIKYEGQKIRHFMRQNVVTNVLSISVLLVENTYPDLHVTLAFSY